MAKVSPKLNSQSGITLVELLVVVLVIAIVASLALMQRGSANEQLQRQNYSRELKVALERARFNSVKRRAVGGSAPAALVIVEPDRFTLRTYATNTSSASDKVTELPSNIRIGMLDGSALTSLNVPFDMRGETPQSPAPRFVVCNGTCPSPLTSSTGSTVDIVLVSRTGTVNLLPGLPNVVPNFNAPAISTVPDTTAINPYVKLPTPTPSPTP